MKALKIGLALISLLAFSMGASAQGMGAGFEVPEFAAIDSNEDGVLSKEEVFAILRANAPKEDIFARWDTDENGSISAEEFAALAAD